VESITGAKVGHAVVGQNDLRGELVEHAHELRFAVCLSYQGARHRVFDGLHQDFRIDRVVLEQQNPEPWRELTRHERAQR